MENEQEKSLREKVQESTFIRSVKIKFPLKLFEKFDKYAEQETNHCYWLAIEKLLAKNDSNSDLRITLLESRVDELESLIQIKPEEKAEKKTFGKK